MITLCEPCVPVTRDYIFLPLSKSVHTQKIHVMLCAGQFWGECGTVRCRLSV